MSENRKISKERNYYIELLRIICTIGVFTGHFLQIGIASNESLAILYYLRNSWAGKTVLSFFFEGDIAVFFFYVTSGFLISYLYENANHNFEKLIKQVFSVLIPALVIIIVHVGALVIYHKDFSESMMLLNDFKCILGGVYHLPHINCGSFII